MTLSVPGSVQSLDAEVLFLENDHNSYTCVINLWKTLLLFPAAAASYLPSHSQQSLGAHGAFRYLDLMCFHKKPQICIRSDSLLEFLGRLPSRIR